MLKSETRGHLLHLHPLAGIGILAAVLGLALSVLGDPPAPAAAPESVEAFESTIDIPTYPWWPPERHPYFRATDGKNIYPYPMLDNLRRIREPRTWRTVVLENGLLRVTFLPDLGGKIYEVIDKTTSKPVFYVNRVVKPGLIGQCGAWVSGGIEFNTGPAGHTVSAVQPVDVEILPPGPGGERSVAVGEVERIYRTRWTVVVTLRPGRSYLQERIRISNPTETVRPYYFWNCTAMPNTPGFRFIYPMTLGTDHAGTTFYTWPMADGKDLSLGRSYQDASSIFAHECDQDFFGSYDTDEDRGVVATADHHLLPGKKAWTWGQGGYGRMHQMDLTDDDGPYNEVQTGPLPTQADVGRLDPSEAVAWDEWWYPVHGIGGFTFANRDIAANAERTEGGLRLRAMGTGTWRAVRVSVLRGKDVLGSVPVRISPGKPTDLRFDFERPGDPVEVEFAVERVPGGAPEAKEAKTPLAPGPILARFRSPLDLPVRTPPKKREEASTATELVRDGWQEVLFARPLEAEARFRKALEKEPKCAAARSGLAHLNLERDPKAAAEEARAAVAIDPDLGPARFTLASAELRLGDTGAALDDAWKAAVDPATAVSARALVAKILLRRGDPAGAARALAAQGPWLSDPLCRDLHALVHLKLGEGPAAARLARQSLAEDPLDAFARSILWLAGDEKDTRGLGALVGGKAQAVLELAATYATAGQDDLALRILREHYVGQPPPKDVDPIPFYWAAWLSGLRGLQEESARLLKTAQALPPDGVFPHRFETVEVLRWALEKEPGDGKAALYLGHLLFHLGRHDEGRALWRRSAERGAGGAVAYRALGMAARKLDGDPKAATDLLGKAHEADPADPIAAMDLAQAILALREKEPAEAQRKAAAQARAILQAAFEGGKGRSDFVALLARLQNRLGDHAATARLLDAVRITIWEGARDVHDLFEEAHLALGAENLRAGRAAEALREFDRALEYPENLATGRLEDAREAHIQVLRAEAFVALGDREKAVEAYRKAASEGPSKDPRKEEARKKAKEALEKGVRLKKEF